MGKETTTYTKHRPPHLQVEEALNALIEQLEPGDQLPPEPTLARDLGVSRATLREVMRTFVERGLLVRRHGVGTFVNARRPVLESGLEVLESIDELAQRIGMETTVAHLELVERLATPEEANGLALTGGTDVKIFSISRVIAVAGQPVAYLTDVVPTAYLTRTELDAAFRGSVLDLFLKRPEPPVTYSRTELRVTRANAALAALLSVNVGAALLHLEAQLYNWEEKVLDYSHSYFLPDHFRFHVIRRVRPA